MQVLYRESESGLKGPNKDLKIEVKDKTGDVLQWKVKDKTGDVLQSRIKIQIKTKTKNYMKLHEWNIISTVSDISILTHQKTYAYLAISSYPPLLPPIALV